MIQLGAEALRALVRGICQSMFWLHYQQLSRHFASNLVCSAYPAVTIGARRLGLMCLILWTVQGPPINFCWAQTASPSRQAYGPASPRPSLAGARMRRAGASQGSHRQPARKAARGPVRTASIEIYDDFGDSIIDGTSDQPYYSDDDIDNGYTETLAPGAVHYGASDGSHFHTGCYTCGAMDGACVCQPFGWLLDWSRGDLWLGSVGFSGASSSLGAAAGDAGQVAGNFGFQQGFNFGTRLPGLLCGQFGSQLGMRFTQSQLDGTSAGADHRTQTFVTAGLFRRVDYGFQGGLVVDYLHDDWVYKADLLQLRGELSYLFSPCHDFGFRFTDSQQTDDTTASIRGLATPIDLRLSGLDTYRFFYRARFGHNAAGQAELQAGFSEDSAAILGASLRAPLQNQLGLDVSATYLLPPSQADLPYTQEGWNLNLALVWTPGRGFGSDHDYYRPLLSVADNGSLLTRHAQR